MAADRASWERIAALREAIRRDALELRNRFAALRDRGRAARAAQHRWVTLAIFARRIVTLLLRWRSGAGKG